MLRFHYFKSDLEIYYLKIMVGKLGRNSGHIKGFMHAQGPHNSLYPSSKNRVKVVQLLESPQLPQTFSSAQNCAWLWLADSQLLWNIGRAFKNQGKPNTIFTVLKSRWILNNFWAAQTYLCVAQSDYDQGNVNLP